MNMDDQMQQELQTELLGKKGHEKTMLELLLPGVWHDDAKKSHVRNYAHEVGKGASGVHVTRCRKILAASESNDIFNAMKEWVLFNYFVTPKGETEPVEIKTGPNAGQMRERRVVQAVGSWTGQGISDLYVLKNPQTNATEQIGENHYAWLESDITKFRATPKDAEQIKAEREKRKQREQKTLDDIVDEPLESFESVQEEIKDRQGLFAQILGVGLDKVKGVYDSLKSLVVARPEIADKGGEDYSISLEKSHGILNWYHSEFEEGKLPNHILPYYMKAKSSVLELSKTDAFVLFSYAAMNRKVRREGIVGSIDQDLELLESEGKFNSKVISDISDEIITLYEASRILQAKSDVLDIRYERNLGATQKYSETTDEILNKLRPIFMDDKYKWRQEYLSGKKERLGAVLASTTLNRGDYSLLKDVLKRLSLGKGTGPENLMNIYSMPEFEQVYKELVVLHRRVGLAEKLAAQQEIVIDDPYNVDPDVLARINAADISKLTARDKERRTVYQPKENFKESSGNETDVDLDRMVVEFDAAATLMLARGAKSDNKSFWNFYDGNFQRIKLLAEEGLYHEHDLKRISANYATFVKARVSRIENVKSHVAGILGRCAGWAKKYGVDLTDQVERIIPSSVKVLSVEQERKLTTLEIYIGPNETQTERVGGRDEHMGRVKYLRESVFDRKRYCGSMDSWTGLSIRILPTFKDGDVSSTVPGFDNVRYLIPTMVKHHAENFSESYKPLDWVVSEDSSFAAKLADLAESQDLREELRRRVQVKISDGAFGMMDELARVAQEDPKSVIIQNKLVEIINDVYEKRCIVVDQLEIESEKREARQKLASQAHLDALLTPESRDVVENAEDAWLTIHANGSRWVDKDTLKPVLPHYVSKVWMTYGVKASDVSKVQEIVRQYNMDKCRDLGIRLVVARDENSAEKYQINEDVIADEGSRRVYDERKDSPGIYVVAKNMRKGVSYLGHRSLALQLVGLRYSGSAKAYAGTLTKGRIDSVLKGIRETNVAHNEQIEVEIYSSIRHYRFVQGKNKSKK